jgi:uncharacterized membrane protein HdeD (DUF308 family)
MSVSTSLLVRGLLAIAVGITSVAWPNITVGAFVVLFAVYAFITAAGDAAKAFAADRAGPVAGWLLLALLSVVAGVVALVWPSITALALTIWIAAWALVTGGGEVGMAFVRGESGGERAEWALGGLISIAFAAVLFIRPDIGALSLATVFGLFSALYGITGVVLAVRFRTSQTSAVGTSGPLMGAMPRPRSHTEERAPGVGKVKGA